MAKRAKGGAPTQLAIFLILLVAFAAAVLYFGGESGSVFDRAIHASEVFKQFTYDVMHTLGFDLGPYEA